MSVLGRACVSGRAACDRSHFAIPSHLPEGMCRPIAQRIWAHYEQGDFDQAESLAHILIRAVAERSELCWSMYAQMLLAMIYMAKDRGGEASRIYQEVISAANLNPSLYADELLEALWGWSLCLFDEGQHDKFQEMVQLFGELPSRDCECYYNIRRAILFGLRDYQLGRTTQAMLSFESVNRYRIMSPHFYSVSMLAIAEISINQRDRGSAQNYLSQIDRYIDWGFRGGLLAWRHRFAGVVSLAEQYGYEWPASSIPLSYLGEAVQRAMPQAEIQIHAFGEGALQLYKQRVMDWHRSPHNKMLLAFLAMHPRGVTTEEIRTFLWPDAPNPAAIHTAVKKL
jgi:tetratricopeptide (TPR) repeat protein